MYVEKFIGAFHQIDALMYWLNIRYGAQANPNHWFDEFNPQHFKFALITSDTGNGKTYLGELLSKDFNVEMFNINSSNLVNDDDMNNFFKSINLQTLDNRKKLIFIDDLDEFSLKYRKKLIELKTISRFPIIYTSTSYMKDIGMIDTKKQSRNKKRKSFIYLKDGFIVKIHKPISSEIKKFLQKKAFNDIPEDVIEKIANESKSVRSAINSLINYSVNELVEPHKTFKDNVNDIKYQRLDKPLDNTLLKVLFDSINGYNDDAKKVMFRCADFDYWMNRKWNEVGRRHINPFIINHLSEPLKKTITYRYKSKKERYKEKEVIVPSKQLVGGVVKDNRYITPRNEDNYFFKFNGPGISVSVIDQIIDVVDGVEFVMHWKDGTIEHYLTTPQELLDSDIHWTNNKDPYEKRDEQRIIPFNKMKKIRTTKSKKANATIDNWGI